MVHFCTHLNKKKGLTIHLNQYYSFWSNHQIFCICLVDSNSSLDNMYNLLFCRSEKRTVINNNLANGRFN